MTLLSRTRHKTIEGPALTIKRDTAVVGRQNAKVPSIPLSVKLMLNGTSSEDADWLQNVDNIMQMFNNNNEILIKREHLVYIPELGALYKKKKKKKKVSICTLLVVALSVLTYCYFLHLYCPNGISTIGNSGCLCWNKPAATESRYPTYGACWFCKCSIIQ